MPFKYLEAGGGDVIGERTIKVRPSETGGNCLIFETAHAAGTRVPPHLHRWEDEAFYVLDGQYEILLGETRFTATSGAFAFAPRGTVHAFSNSGSGSGRMLVTVTPGTGHEGMMREAVELGKQSGKQLTPAQLKELALKYGWVWIE
jgi:quercetin dioxygenase-like cupin family protein